MRPWINNVGDGKTIYLEHPEKGQDFSNMAKEFVSDYVFGKVVSVRQMNMMSVIFNN